MNLNRLSRFSSQSIDLEQRKWKIYTTSKYCRRQNDNHETRVAEHPINGDQRIIGPIMNIDARVIPSQTGDSMLMRNGYFQ